MWHARFDITCDPWVPGYNHAIWANVSEAAPGKPKIAEVQLLVQAL